MPTKLPQRQFGANTKLLDRQANMINYLFNKDLQKKLELMLELKNTTTETIVE